jgi:hypothetical protein
MAKIITVTIDEHGDSSVDLEGYHGVGCDAVSKAFTSAIGNEGTVRHKAERNKPCQTKTQLTQGR